MQRTRNCYPRLRDIAVPAEKALDTAIADAKKKIAEQLAADSDDDE